MEVDQKKTGGDMKVECKLRSGGDMPTPRIKYNLNFEFSRALCYSLFSRVQQEEKKLSLQQLTNDNKNTVKKLRNMTNTSLTLVQKGQP